MPKRIGQTPSWLCRPSPGARIFSDPVPRPPNSPTKRTSSSIIDTNSQDYDGPRRLIAQRGTEIFVAVGNKLRWADLAKIKDQWEDESRKPGQDADEAPYKTMNLPTYFPIRQLVMSSSEHFLAVCTDHTVHVVPLPDHASLSTSRKATVGSRPFHLGPTTHVVESSPIVSVLWHPLAVATASTDCLITVTADAAVRVWEIDRSNQFSFEQPALDIDLRKLADGVSCDQDFQSAAFGKNKGFSVDDVDMEVAGVCFGGRGEDSEDPWASMTLWTAMKNGDVYALCPLLPSRWQPTETTVPSLSTSAVSRMATIASENVDLDERRAADQQYEWVSELDSDEPLAYDADDPAFEVRLRPLNPSAIPRLQGPYELNAGEDEDFEVTDIVVLPPRLDEDDLYSGEELLENHASTTLPYATVMLACSDGRLRVGLNVDGVSGQWLPKKGRSTFSVPSAEPQELVHLTTIDFHTSSDEVFVCLTPDVIHRYTVYASVNSRLLSISLDDWISRVAEEILHDTEADERLQTRLGTACQHQIAVVDPVLEVKESLTEPLSAPAVIDDLDVGYLVLSTSTLSVHGAIFDQAHVRSILFQQSNRFAASQSLGGAQLHGSNADRDAVDDFPPSRDVYQPSRSFDLTADYHINQLKHRLPHQQRRILTEEPMRLSPAVLDLMTSAHRTVSSYTAELETAAAELFRRCERLREELGEQVKQMSDLADRLQHIKNQADGEESRPGEEKLSHDQRMDNIKQKQQELKKRFDVLRRKAGKASSSKKELSQKEAVWIQEVESIGQQVGEKDATEQQKDSLEARYETAKTLSRQLREEAKRLEALPQEAGDLGASQSSITSRRSSNFPIVSSRYQKERIAEVMGLVEREGAVIEAVTGRLERMKVESGLA